MKNALQRANDKYDRDFKEEKARIKKNETTRGYFAAFSQVDDGSAD